MIVTRFAPSPTGYLHLGHAFAAITASRSGDRFILRIEDLDAARCREVFVEAIFEDLHWLGLNWQEPVLRQSLRGKDYQNALERLEKMDLLYPCFCTRKEIALEMAQAAEAPPNSGSIYPGTCRRLSKSRRQERLERGEPYALRLDTKRARARTGALSFVEHGLGPLGEHGTVIVDWDRLGDVVLSRKGLTAAYHLAVVIDDAAQNINLVTRGNDLFASTPIQRLLQALLDLPAPNYAHHRLIQNAQGEKFSKRDNAVTLRSLRAQATSPKDIRQMLGISFAKPI